MNEYCEPMYERIRRIRLLRDKYLKDEGCKEKNFAKFLKIDPSRLKRIESGEESPSAETLSKMSKCLKVSIEHLLEHRVMAEDELAEPIVFKPQIGSVIHAARLNRINGARKNNWRQYSLKSIAKKLDISSMELKRIEDLNKSKHLDSDVFLHKIASLFDLSLTYIKDLVETSFPRGEKKKEAISSDADAVHYVRDGNRVKGLVVLSDSINKNDLDILKKRIELEVEMLRSKPSKQ